MYISVTNTEGMQADRVTAAWRFCFADKQGGSSYAIEKVREGKKYSHLPRTPNVIVEPEKTVARHLHCARFALCRDNNLNNSRLLTIFANPTLKQTSCTSRIDFL